MVYKRNRLIVLLMTALALVAGVFLLAVVALFLGGFTVYPSAAFAAQPQLQWSHSPADYSLMVATDFMSTDRLAQVANWYKNYHCWQIDPTSPLACDLLHLKIMNFNLARFIEIQTLPDHNTSIRLTTILTYFR